MTPIYSIILGVVFWAISLYSVTTMAWMWKYNDPSKHTTDSDTDDADLWKTTLKKWVISHRLAGLIYVILYILMMSQMVPMMWTYQIELPARTVVHLVLGISIGIILTCKICIIRFFKHLGSVLPVFGFLLFFLTTILLFVSVPFALQEQRLLRSMKAFSEENMERLTRLLPKAGYTKEETDALVSVHNLKAGRNVLLQKCVQCHDLRTMLAKPRTPKGWHDLVIRMATKPSVGITIDQDDVDFVTLYLVGITPDLQESLKQKRSSSPSTTVKTPKLTLPSKISDDFDMSKAKLLTEETCTQCHEMEEIINHGGDTMEGWTKIMERMVEENGLYEEPEILKEILQYLSSMYPPQVSIKSNSKNIE